MTEPTNCPHCHVSLIGAPIPEKDRHCYGTATHFRREIGVEIPGFYDGVAYWECPDCHGKWHRWSKTMRKGLDKHVDTITFADLHP